MHDLYTAKLLNGELEQILYWFWDEDSVLPGDRYRDTIDRLVEKTPFTIVFHTPRSRKFQNLADSDQIRAITDAAAHAHSRGLKFGIEVIPESRRPDKLEDMQGVVVDTVWPIEDEDVRLGHKRVTVKVKPEVSYTCQLRVARVQHTALLRAYLYRPVDWCHFEPGTLVNVTEHAECKSGEPGVASVSIPIEPGLSGHVVRVQTVHYYDYPNFWSGFVFETVKSVLETYAPANLDGAVFDEVGVYPCRPGMVEGKTGWHEQWYCKGMSEAYKQATGRPLEDDLLYMKVVPAGQDGRRTKALTDYFDLHRSQVTKLENSFYELVKKICGSDAFVAAHSTWHNGAPEDMWHDGLSWWEARRDFGQTDEGLAPAVGLALGRKWGGRVWYDMFYSRQLDEVYRHAVDIARIGGRLHYHALNDTGYFGCDLDDPAFFEQVTKIETMMRLLNWFQTELPKSDILVVMGYPEMVTADKPDTEFGMSSRFREGFNVARMLWDMGFRCDLVPSYEIDDNDLRVCCSGGVHYGQTGSYSLLVYVLPEFSKPSTLDFLQRFQATGGRLIFVGECSRDVDGNDVSNLFAELRHASLATFAQTPLSDSDRTLLCELLSQLGFRRNDIPSGTRFTDQEVVIVQDHESILDQSAAALEFAISGRTVAACFNGLLAIRLTPEGGLERLAASGLSSLSIDGEYIFEFDTPRDLLAHKNDRNSELLVVYPEQSLVPSVVETASLHAKTES